MPLSWNEIKARAIAFSRDWADETRETAEAKSFWDAFFNVFGMARRAARRWDWKWQVSIISALSNTNRYSAPRFAKIVPIGTCCRWTSGI